MKIIILLCFFAFSTLSFAEMTTEEYEGWIYFNRTTAPQPDAKIQEGIIIINNGRETNGEVFADVFGEIKIDGLQVNKIKSFHTDIK